MSQVKYFQLAILISFFLVFSFSANAQLLRTSSDILATALESQAVFLQNQKSDFLKNNSPKLPVFEEVEFRSETDEMDFNRQEYMLRLNVNSEKERRKLKHFNQARIQVLDLEKQLLLKEALQDRYFLLVQYIFRQKELEQAANLKLVLEDQIAVMRRLAVATTKFDLDDLIDAEDDLHELDRDILRMKGDLDYTIIRLQQFLKTDQNFQIDTTDLVDLTEIKTIVDQLPKQSTSNLRLLEQQAQIDEVIAEYAFEDAEARKVIDFVQFKYANRDDTDYAKEWSLGFGLRIPTSRPNQLNFSELQLDQIEEENNYKNLELRLQARLQNGFRKKDLLFEQFDLVTRQLKESQSTYSMQNLNQLTGLPPLLLLQVKESQLKRQNRLLQIEYDIYLNYLDLIDLSGKVMEMPLRNYLSKGLKSF